MELYAVDLHFMGDTLSEQDFDSCAHGKVVCIIDGCNLSNSDSDWCVSASAYRFLHSLFVNHVSNAEQQMIPCCGHFMIPSEDGTTVTISGCTNGIDFDITHEDEYVIIRTEDDCTYKVPFEEYKAAVCAYAEQIEEFYHQNSPRRFADKYDQSGFAAFCNEWYELMRKAATLTDEILGAPAVTFDDYDAYREDSIAGISPQGIALKDMSFISFRECADNFARVHEGSGKCVGKREVSGSNPSFWFYTAPKTKHISFLPKNKCEQIFMKKNAMRRFRNLQKQIEAYGFTTYDNS